MASIPVNCALQEIFSALLEIEEHILTKKTATWRWGSTSDSHSVTETLYALAFLVFLRGRLEKDVESILFDLVLEAKQQLTNSREFLKPFVLGQAALVYLKRESIDDGIQVLKNTLFKFLDNSPTEHIIEILYSLSLFVNLLHKIREFDNSEFITKLNNQVKEVLNANLDSLSPDLFSKLLYALSAFSQSKKELRILFDNHKHRILTLREQVSSLMTKAALLRSFSILKVDCHKTIIEEALEPIRNRKEPGVYRNLRNRIARFFLYGEETENGIELRMDTDKPIELLVKLAPNELDHLREADYSMEYASIIGICIITAGYSQIFIVPPLEEEEYLKFLKSDSKEHDYVKKKSIVALVNGQINEKMRADDLKIILGLILIVISGVVLSQFFDFLQSISSTLVLFLFTQIVLKIYSDRSKSLPLDLYHRIFKRRALKNALQEKIVDTLDVSDGWELGRDY